MRKSTVQWEFSEQYVILTDKNRIDLSNTRRIWEADLPLL